MKLIKILVMLLLISNLAVAANNVEVRFNNGTDTIFIGARNTMEIWIENDETLQGMVLSFEFASYSGQIIWDTTYGNNAPVNGENDMIGAYSRLNSNTHGFDDTYLTDSIEIGSAFFPPMYIGLPVNGLRRCITMQFEIPSGEPTGSFCVDNIHIPPSTFSWLFDFGGGSGYPPDYFGCVNADYDNPDCPAVCFPVVNATYMCGDVNNDASVNISDVVYILNYIFYDGPYPVSMLSGDVNCNGRINMGDIGFLRDYLFSSGAAPCQACP
jgi:Dockerin type I domain